MAHAAPLPMQQAGLPQRERNTRLRTCFFFIFQAGAKGDERSGGTYPYGLPVRPLIVNSTATISGGVVAGYPRSAFEKLSPLQFLFWFKVRR